MHQRLTNRSAKPGVGAGVLGPGDRMPGNEVNARRDVRRHIAQHRAFDRADVGDHGACLQVRSDLGGNDPALTHRNGDDDEVGALHGRRIGLHDLVGKPELDDAPARGGGPRRRHDRAYAALRARSPRNRRADQADADQGEAIEEG